MAMMTHPRLSFISKDSRTTLQWHHGIHSTHLLVCSRKGMAMLLLLTLLLP
jgi:hypothetical protein